MRTNQYIYIAVTNIDTGEVWTGDDVLIGGDGSVCLNGSMTAQGDYRVHITIRPTVDSEVERSFVYAFFNKDHQRAIVE